MCTVCCQFLITELITIIIVSGWLKRLEIDTFIEHHVAVALIATIFYQLWH